MTEPDAPVWSVVGPLFGHFAVLSLMAIGGGVVMVAPEIQRYVVDSHHWMTAEQFSAAYAIAQAAPGPNMLYTNARRVAGRRMDSRERGLRATSSRAPLSRAPPPGRPRPGPTGQLPVTAAPGSRHESAHKPGQHT